MIFSYLNINLSQQSICQTFQRQFESLKNWGSHIFRVLENHPYALHRHSSGAIAGVILTINALFFVFMRYLVNRLESSLNKKFPSIPTAHLVLSSALIGGAVGALNLVLFKHARLPMARLTLYTIGVSAAALHLIFKPSVCSVPPAQQSLPPPVPPLQTAPLVLPISGSSAPPPVEPTKSSAIFQPQVRRNPLLSESVPSVLYLAPIPATRQSSTGTLLAPLPKPVDTSRSSSESSEAYDLSTPMPTARLSPARTPILSPRTPHKRKSPATSVPKLYVLDLEVIEGKVLEEINNTRSKSDDLSRLMSEQQSFLEQLEKALLSNPNTHEIKRGIATIKTALKESEKYQLQLNEELAVQGKLLTEIQNKKLGALLSAQRSGLDTPEGKYRQHLLQGIESRSRNLLQDPVELKSSILQVRLEFPQNVDCGDTHAGYTASSSESTILGPDFPSGEYLNLFGEEEVDDRLSPQDQEYFEIVDEEGNVYYQHPSGFFVDIEGYCFDKEGKFLWQIQFQEFPIQT